MSLLRRVLLPLALLCIAPLPAAAATADNAAEESPLWDFVPGDYHLIGRWPDSARSFIGTARIARQGDALHLTLRAGPQQWTARGTVRRAMPGEAMVVAFAWTAPVGQTSKTARAPATKMEMVCQVGSDLDNYARLTCLWGKAGNPHRLPGMAALFSAEPWRQP